MDGTDRVHVFRYGGAQAMFIVTPDGVIATDPIGYGRSDRGQVYLSEIRKATQAPIRTSFYSHHHFDHAAGGQAASRRPAPSSSRIATRRRDSNGCAIPTR